MGGGEVLRVRILKQVNVQPSSTLSHAPALVSHNATKLSDTINNQKDTPPTHLQQLQGRPRGV